MSEFGILFFIDNCILCGKGTQEISSYLGYCGAPHGKQKALETDGWFFCGKAKTIARRLKSVVHLLDSVYVDDRCPQNIRSGEQNGLKISCT